jgi:ubiquitin carboxyl-terminal hydrolase 34
MIQKTLSSQTETTTEEEGTSMDLNILANLIHCVSYPYLVYHKDFIQEYGPEFVKLCIKKLRDAPEKSLRDVRREKIESIIKSIDNFQRRLISKEEREKQTEILKLEVSLMCLKSGFLERRIQGIRDLNQIIKNNRMFSSKNFTSTFLVQWMQDNGVFTILFDTKKTHL